jgi:alpha-mannosidase
MMKTAGMRALYHSRIHDMRRLSYLALACLAFGGTAAAQEPASAGFGIPSQWLQGYVRRVSGEVIGYPWAYPGQTHALLTRAVDGTRVIEWEGEPAPAGPDNLPVVYLWHGGLASGYGAHRFTLSVNGTACASFNSGRDSADRTWAHVGEGGCAVSFRTLRVGTFNELFGLMMLTAPRRLIGSGPPRFSVVGESAGSQDYYMTHEERVEPWTRVRAEQARFRDGRRAIRLDVSRIGERATLVVRSGGAELLRGTVNPGYNQVSVPANGTATSLPVTVEIGGQVTLDLTLSLPPVRPWEIHLLPHSHVDIGYSDPQPVVEQKQWKNLRDAVALAEATASNPPESRFRWNVEGLWSVETYLKQASPEDRGRFVGAVTQGSIGLQANLTNILTGLCTPEELTRWTDSARRLQSSYGLPVGRSAMHTDIPGLSWTVASALARGGVRYFSSGPNYMPSSPDMGDRIGETLRALGDQPFWWVSPSGQERVLFWMAGRGYSLFHGMNTGAIEISGRQTLLDYVFELQEKGYAYDLVQVRYTIGGDNGPVDPKLPEFVKAWNETFETPRLVISTADSLFEALEKRHGATLPERRGDMTPYWEDGAVSSAAEEAMARAAARRLQQAETLWAMRGGATYPVEAFAEAWRQVLLWHEHTWGAADSISQPDRKDVVDRWLYKRAFAVEADRQSRALLDQASGVGQASGLSFHIVNTLSWSRNGMVFLPAEATKGRDRVVDGSGRVIPSQRLSDGRLAARVNVPALGAIRIRVGPGAATPQPAAIRGNAPVVATKSSLDNSQVRVEIDPKTGNISRMTSVSAPGVQFVRGGAGLNAYLYVPGRDPSAAVGPGAPTIRVIDAGPLVGTIEVSSQAPGVSRLVRRVSLVAGGDSVELDMSLDKTLVREKESAHLAFPLNVPGGVVRADQGEALVAIEADQLPGSCKDFIGVPGAIDVSSRTAGVSIASLDAPLFELGGLTDERSVNGGPRGWKKAPGGTDLYAYLLNNYWHTNYKADQSGPMTFRFRVRPHAAFDAAALRRFGAGTEQPLLALPTTAGARLPALPFALVGPNVVASEVKPADDGRGFVVRVYNPTSSAATVSVVATSQRVGIWSVGSDGTPGPAITGVVRLPAFGTRVLLIGEQ